MLTKKDFVSLAKVVSQLDLPPTHHAVVVENLCIWGRAQNPRFDAQRFAAASIEGREKSIYHGGSLCDDCGNDTYRREGAALVCRLCGCSYDNVACPECHKAITDTGECACN